LVGLISAYIEHFTYLGLFVVPAAVRTWDADSGRRRAVGGRLHGASGDHALSDHAGGLVGRRRSRRQLSFLLGRRFGTGWVRYFGIGRPGRQVQIERIQKFMQRHGHRAIFYARFLAGLRALIYLSAGSFGVRTGGFPGLRSAGRGHLGADRGDARICFRQATRNDRQVSRRLRAPDRDRADPERAAVWDADVRGQEAAARPERVGKLSARDRTPKPTHAPGAMGFGLPVYPHEDKMRRYAPVRTGEEEGRRTHFFCVRPFLRHPERSLRSRRTPDSGSSLRRSGEPSPPRRAATRPPCASGTSVE